jgi:hypothetical protein
MEKRQKRNPLALLALFAGGILVGEVSGVATAFSLPETWRKLTDLVSNLVRPLADDRVDDVGFGLLAVGLALFVLGLVLAYRRLRGRAAVPGDLQDLMPEMSNDQEALLTLLLQHGITLRVPSDRPPRRALLAFAVPIIAIGAVMVLSNSLQNGKRHFPRVALGPAKALTKPGGETASQGSNHAVEGGAGGVEAAQEAGASASGSTLPLKKEGSSCTCPPVIPTHESTGGESESVFESGPEEEPDFEAEEAQFEAEEAELEAEEAGLGAEEEFES